MTISTADFARIQKIIRDRTKGISPYNLRYEDGAIRFIMMQGEEVTERVCQALLAAGLQSTVGDGESEYFKSGTEGASRVSVRWPFDPDRPTWND